MRAKLVTVIWLLSFCSIVHAGNVDPDADGHRYAYGENIGWCSFEPAQGPGVTVSDTGVSGFAWSETVGWINMSPAGFAGVTHDGNGNLAGYAWGENIGWISFSCENTASCQTVDYGVTIDPATGEFAGFAWSENAGWLNFDHSFVANWVTTAWRESGGTQSKSGGCYIGTSAGEGTWTKSANRH